MLESTGSAREAEAVSGAAGWPALLVPSALVDATASASPPNQRLQLADAVRLEENEEDGH